MTSDKPLSSKAILVVIGLVVLVCAGWYVSTLRKPVENTQIKSDQTTNDVKSDATDSDKTTTPEANVAPTSKPTQEEISKTDISDWKTYSNEEYGYEIKYPKDWSVITREDYQVHFLAPETPKFDTSMDEPGEGNIFITMDKSSQASGVPSQYASKSTIVIDENSADLYEGVAGGDDPSAPFVVYTSVRMEKNQNTLSFNFSDVVNRKNDDKYAVDYYKMLSTVKFVK